ncbi:Bcr/CflA family multidrug efflux MFS transporter [Motilimonas pumila]|uniref:Bcr/CflA family efflux transporter n=1 Tax=Motilimonas pumila TaxID=2303987 RepID=A0A418YDB9_9GAMM|nr:Bcr/CflA family multidrug efflux MFS transporter [Motilimonas pumila]RJG42520.1 Bcr/CflA family drug resistance efflux transporter [Motilimonas pumila]
MKSVSIPVGLLLILALLSGLAPMAIDMYLPAMPTIESALGASAQQVQLTLSVFLIGFAIGQLVYGPLSDSFGRKGIMLTGLAIFTLTNLAVMIVDDISTLTLLRFFQAIGGGAASVIVGALIRDMYQREQFSKIMSFVILIMTLAPLVAPTLGGVLITIAPWQAIFYCLAGLGAITMLAVYFGIKETLPESKRVPFNARNIANNYGQVLKNLRALGYMLVGGCSIAGMFVFLTTSPHIYIDYLAIPAEHYGLYFGLNVLMMMTATWCNSQLVERYGSDTMIKIGLGVISLMAGVFLYIGLSHSENATLIIAACVGFVGMMPLIGSNCMAGILSEFGDIAGTATAMTGTVRFAIGGAAGAFASLWYVPDASVLAFGMVLSAVCSVSAYVLLVHKHKPALQISRQA